MVYMLHRLHKGIIIHMKALDIAHSLVKAMTIKSFNAREMYYTTQGQVSVCSRFITATSEAFIQHSPFLE